MFDKLSSYVNQKPRRSIAAATFTLLLIVFIWAVVQNSGKVSVSIKTNDPAGTIELSQLGASSSTATSQGVLHTQVRPGSYLVAVNNKVSSAKRIIDVRRSQDNTYTIDLGDNIVTTYVLPLGATSVYAGGSNLFYINSADHLLYSIGADGIPKPVSESVGFDKVVWQNGIYGVGLSTDRKSLYAVTGNSLVPIGLPFSNKRVVFGLGQTGRLVVSDGKSLYVQTGNGFSKIYSSTNPINSVSVGLDKILVGLNNIVKLVNFDGTVVATGEFSFYTAEWSPDGQKLALTNDSSTAIYDNKLNKILGVPDSNVTGLGWQGNQSLIYGVGGQLIKFSVTGLTSNQIASSGGNTNIISIYPSSNGMVYILTSQKDNTSNYSLVSVDLKSKPAPSFYQTIGIFFPSSSGQCSFSYTNYLHPTIIITAWSDQNACINAAQQELSADGLPASAFNIAFSPLSND